MRLMTALFLAALTACTPTKEDSVPSADDSTAAVEDSSTDSPTDSPQDSPEDTATCAEEGEACEIFEDGTSSCCIGRHTCFPEGCYYSQP